MRRFLRRYVDPVLEFRKVHSFANVTNLDHDVVQCFRIRYIKLLILCETLFIVSTVSLPELYTYPEDCINPDHPAV